MKITRDIVDQSLKAHSDLQSDVSEKKYQMVSGNTLVDKSFGEVIGRVAKFVDENAPDEYTNGLKSKIIKTLREGKIIPAGSILSGLGNPLTESSLSNCYFTPIMHDSIEEIFDCLKRMARIYSYRGGSGVDLTVLRPKGYPVNNAAKASSGAVSFLPTFDEVTKRIGQNGRRGAMMALLDIRHPDALDFIEAKSNPGKVFGIDPLTGETPSISGANLSLKIPDSFMRAVEEDKEWHFIFPTMEVIQGGLKSDNLIELKPAVFEAMAPLANDVVVSGGKVFKIIEANYDAKTLHVENPDGNIEAGENGKVLFTHCRAKNVLGDVLTKFSRDVYSKLWDGDYYLWLSEYDQVCGGHGSMKARDILEKIAAASHATGDPGVMFSDRCAMGSPGSYIHNALIPTGSNPCGEEPLPKFGNCCLIAVALHKFVSNPWTENAEFNFDAFKSAVADAVYLQDVVVTENIERHPLPVQRHLDRFSRRIGVEPTGLADMLAMLGLKYGSRKAVDFTEKVMRTKARTEIMTSLELADMLGCAPALASEESRNRILEHPYFTQLELGENATIAIRKHGLRNCSWSTAGPCGSISIMSDNCTSGIEPLFRFSYQRRTRMGGDGAFYDFIHLPALKHIAENMEAFEGMDVSAAGLKLGYVPANAVPISERLSMQAAVQKYTDAGVSSTINLSEDTPVESIAITYLNAWKHDLKGVTVFRDGCKQGVLSESKDAPEKTETPELHEYELKLNDVETAYRHRVMLGETKLYIIVSVDADDMPIEIFVKLPREAGMDGSGKYSEAKFQEVYSLWDTICRLTSLILRRGASLERVIGQMDKSSYSMTDAAGVISRILKKYLPDTLEPGTEDAVIIEGELGDKCPSCDEKTFVRENGCEICKSCGYALC